MSGHAMPGPVGKQRPVASKINPHWELMSQNWPAGHVFPINPPQTSMLLSGLASVLASGAAGGMPTSVVSGAGVCDGGVEPPSPDVPPTAAALGSFPSSALSVLGHPTASRVNAKNECNIRNG